MKEHKAWAVNGFVKERLFYIATIKTVDDRVCCHASPGGDVQWIRQLVLQ